MVPIIGGVVGAVLVVVILVVVIVVVAVWTVKRNSLSKSVDLNDDDDVAHCSVNPSYDTVHSATTNKHNIVYDEVHTTPSCTDNPAYGTQ